MEERESKRDAMKDWRCVVLFGVVGKIFTGFVLQSFCMRADVTTFSCS